MKIPLDSLRQLCLSAASAVVACRKALPGVRAIVRVVKRWALWRGGRKRPRVTRQWVGPIRLDLVYSKRHGYRLVAWAVMEGVGRHRSAGPTRSIDVPKKPAASSPGGDAPRQAATRPKILEKTPTVAGFLLDLQYEDGGGPREPSYLIVKAAGGEWLVTLKDPTEARQLRTRVTDLGTAYAALEALLTCDSCPWEPDSWALGKKPGRRQRGS